MKTHTKVVDDILASLHEKFGVCGHCGKKSCAFKQSYSTLPEKLKTSDVIAAIENSGKHKD